MKRLQEFLGIEDHYVPELCLSGIGITGRASESPFFEPFEVPPSMSKKDFYSSTRERSLKMIERVKFMAQKGDPKLASAIWEKTQKEVKKGTMGPPLTISQVEQRYGPDFQVTPSFGLEQGVNEAGAPKYRRIDDYTASGVNPSAHRTQKVPMCMVDYIGVMIRAAAQVDTNIYFATEDMASAYRQVPLDPRDVRYAITGVYDPSSGEVWLHEMYGQPFGAGHAVPNFCRIAEWLARCLQRLFDMHIDHFFDDFFIVEPKRTIASAVHCMKEAFKLLGFLLGPEKSQPPTTSCPILGIMFDTSSLSRKGVVHLSSKPSRVQNLCSVIDIDKVLMNQDLSPSLAASIVGKFGFLCSALFGKVGRCCTGPLRQRQYSTLPYHSVSQDMEVSLRLMCAFLQSAPSRELRLRHQSPILLYTDASDVPGRSPQRLLGAFLFDPLDQKSFYSSWAVPPAVVDRWIPKKSQMGQLELLAAPFACTTWQDRLKNRAIILFIDNDSAASNLVKGYSAKTDSTAIVGSFWLQMADLRCHVYIDRVESKSNPADGPSRNDFTLVRSLGGVYTPPRTGTLGDLTAPLPSWFSAPKHRGERGKHPRTPHTGGI